jgi:hypothetical protein
MTRTSVGTDTQARSDTALLAHVAYKLEGVATKDLSRWAVALGISVGEQAIRKAPRTAARMQGQARARVVGPRTEVDYAALNFFQAMVTLQPSSPREQTTRELERVCGVVELLAAEDRDELFALVVYERLSDKRTLRGRLAEHGDVIDWCAIEQRRTAAAAATFRALARQAAKRERLTLR